MPELASQLLIGIVIAALSAWITVQLSLRKFRTERWWELKVESYQKVIEALHFAKTYPDKYLDATMEGRSLPEERQNELFNQAKKGADEIDKAIDVGEFTLSEKALARLREYQNEINEHRKHKNLWIYLEGQIKASKDCLSDFIEIAREDLKAKRS